MRHTLFLFVFFNSFVFSQSNDSIQIHGHRGYRGRFPENSIVGFIEAVKSGVKILELDVVISADSQVVVSHDHWFNSKICYSSSGTKSKKMNIYKLPYSSIKQVDCGINGNPKFREQKHISVVKPLLSDLIDTIEKFCTANDIAPVYYNIEIKSRKISDNKYHPSPNIFVKLLMDVLNKYKIGERLMIQSFDLRSIIEVHKQKPDIKTGVLVVYPRSVKRCTRKLGFVPYMYNPNARFVSAKVIHQAHKQNIKVVVWTSNTAKQVKKLKHAGVDGIITDYPEDVKIFWQKY